MPLSSMLEQIRTVMIDQATWSNYCTSQYYNIMLQSCPHLITPLFQQLQSIHTPINLPTQDKTIGSQIELQYNRILNKIKKYKSLEDTRIGLVSQLHQLLQDCSDLSPSLVNQLLQGSVLVDDMSPSSAGANNRNNRTPIAAREIDRRTGEEVLSAESTLFQDLLASLETDLKYEDVFWKWLLPFNSKSNSVVDDDNQSVASSATVNSTSTSVTTGSNMETRYRGYLKSIEEQLWPILFQGKLSCDSMDQLASDEDKSLLDLLHASPDSSSNPVYDTAGSYTSKDDIVLQILQYLVGKSGVEGVDMDIEELRAQHSTAVQHIIDNISQACPYAIIP
jgi:hypothetical protein